MRGFAPLVALVRWMSRVLVLGELTNPLHAATRSTRFRLRSLIAIFDLFFVRRNVK